MNACMFNSSGGYISRSIISSTASSMNWKMRSTLKVEHRLPYRSNLNQLAIAIRCLPDGSMIEALAITQLTTLIQKVSNV